MKKFWSTVAKYALKLGVWAAENPQQVETIINTAKKV